MTASTAATDLAAYLGSQVDPATAEAHLAAVEQSVKAYTRGHGFDEFGFPEDDLAVVILSAAARSYANPSHARSESAGPFQRTPGAFTGWTLPELAILNRHRKRAH